MGARRRTRQTSHPVPGMIVHARHNRHDPNYTWQQFRAEQAEELQEATDREIAAYRKARRDEQPEAA